MASMDGSDAPAMSPDCLEMAEDILIPEALIQKRKLPKTSKTFEITSRTIKTPPFSYTWLELISDPPTATKLDDLTVRSYLTAAFTQFLGLTGSAISVDILKVDVKECWIRVPREDLSVVVAALGGWMGRGENDAEVGWRIRGSGNWLNSLVGKRGIEKLWS